MIVRGSDNTTLTITALNSLATDTNLLAGWTSQAITVASADEADHLITGQIKVSGTAPTVGKSIILMAYSALLSNPTWPDLFSAGVEGSAGAATINSDEIKNSGLVHVWSTAISATASAVYTIPQTSIAQAFGGNIPDSYCLFLTQDTGQAINSSGNSLTIKPIDYI